MHKDINVNVSGPIQPTSTYKTKVLKGNHSFASQVTEPNMKYVIKHNFDLEDESVTIPANCVLEFDGGSISGNTLELSSNVTINGNNTTFVVPENTQIIKAESKTGIKIYNCVFDCRNNAHRSYEFGGIFFKNCSDIIVKGCEFFGKEDGSSGRIGLSMLKCDDTLIEDSKFSYFYDPDFWHTGSGKPTSWATYFISIKNSIIRNNKFIKTYSGIKLSGWIENIQVTNNYSIDSITDGLDFAGISAKNISICNNTFIGNNDNGVEFKILEYSSGHYDDTLNYYGYSFDTPRYFKDIVISNNVFIGHRGISIVNAFTKYQESALLSEEKTIMFDDNNIGNVCIANNTVEYIPSSSMLPTGYCNPNSSFGLFILFAVTAQQDVVFDNNKFSGSFGLYIVSSCNLKFTNNLVNAINAAIYFRREDNRILNYNNNIENNSFITKNGPYLDVRVNQGIEEAYNNVFNNNKFLKTIHNNNAVMPTLSVYNQFIKNKYGKSWISIDRRYVKDDGSPCNISCCGSTFYRENGFVKGFKYFNTDTNTLDILKTVGVPVKIRFRITKIPTRTGSITFSWTVDTIKREEGQNPSITINIDKVPESIVEYVNILSEQVKMSRWYMDLEVDNQTSPSWFILFCSKEHYAYFTPPSPQYSTTTDAEFVPSYFNGEEESWMSLSSSE